MAEKYTIRGYLTFKALIARAHKPRVQVEQILAAHPHWDLEEMRTWEAWNADLSVQMARTFRTVQDADLKEGIL